MTGRIRFIPREVQLRLDEPSDDELLALIHAEQTARTQQEWDDARWATTSLWRSLNEHPRYLAILDRTRVLRGGRANIDDDRQIEPAPSERAR